MRIKLRKTSSTARMQEVQQLPYIHQHRWKKNRSIRRSTKSRVQIVRSRSSCQSTHRAIIATSAKQLITARSSTLTHHKPHSKLQLLTKLYLMLKRRNHHSTALPLHLRLVKSFSTCVHSQKMRAIRAPARLKARMTITQMIPNSDLSKRGLIYNFYTRQI